ncbi:Uncharacterised protein [uncultured archaeon]|nr:Uncharacterised protein [uncultured archaeon]
MRRLALIAVLAMFGALFSGCVSMNPGTSQPSAGFCGRSTNGACSADSDCVRGGCSSQVCQSRSESSAITTCEYADCYDPQPYGMGCGCLSGGCQWKGIQYNPIQVGK